MNKQFLSGLFAIIIGFVVGLVFAMLLGIKFDNGGITTYMPQDILVPMIKSFTGVDLSGRESFNLRYVGEFIVAAMPLILTGLSVAFAFKTGLFNIGAEGQVMAGSLTAVMLGLYLDLPPIIHPIVCLIGAALAGFVVAFVPGFLKARFNVHEVVTCIMMNYIVLYFCNWAYRATPGFALEKTPEVRETALLSSQLLSQMTNGSRLNWSILVVALGLVAYWFIVNKTTLGYRLKAIGHNRDAAEYAGMNVSRGIITSMGISGLFAGLAGACIVLGVFGYGRTLTSFENYGYEGIAVALVGANSAIGILFSGALFAVLETSQPLIQASGVPREIAVIISALIIIFCAVPMLYKKYVDLFSDKIEQRKQKRYDKKLKNKGGNK